MDLEARSLKKLIIIVLYFLNLRSCLIEICKEISNKYFLLLVFIINSLNYILQILRMSVLSGTDIFTFFN